MIPVRYNYVSGDPDTSALTTSLFNLYSRTCKKIEFLVSSFVKWFNIKSPAPLVRGYNTKPKENKT